MRYQRRVNSIAPGGGVSVPNLSPIAASLADAANQEASRLGFEAGFTEQKLPMLAGTAFRAAHHKGLQEGTLYRGMNDLQVAEDLARMAAVDPKTRGQALPLYDEATQKIFSRIGDEGVLRRVKIRSDVHKARVMLVVHQLNTADAEQTTTDERIALVADIGGQDWTGDWAANNLAFNGFGDKADVVRTNAWTAATGLNSHGEVPKWVKRAQYLGRQVATGGEDINGAYAVMKGQLNEVQKVMGGMFTDMQKNSILTAFVLHAEGNKISQRIFDLQDKGNVDALGLTTEREQMAKAASDKYPDLGISQGAFMDAANEAVEFQRTVDADNARKAEQARAAEENAAIKSVRENAALDIANYVDTGKIPESIDDKLQSEHLTPRQRYVYEALRDYGHLTDELARSFVSDGERNKTVDMLRRDRGIFPSEQGKFEIVVNAAKGLAVDNYRQLNNFTPILPAPKDSVDGFVAWQYGVLDELNYRKRTLESKGSTLPIISSGEMNLITAAGGNNALSVDVLDVIGFENLDFDLQVSLARQIIKFSGPITEAVVDRYERELSTHGAFDPTTAKMMSFYLASITADRAEGNYRDDTQLTVQSVLFDNNRPRPLGVFAFYKGSNKDMVDNIRAGDLFVIPPDTDIRHKTEPDQKTLDNVMRGLRKGKFYFDPSGIKYGRLGTLMRVYRSAPDGTRALVDDNGNDIYVLLPRDFATREVESPEEEQSRQVYNRRFEQSIRPPNSNRGIYDWRMGAVR